jgi:hypothetical protein
MRRCPSTDAREGVSEADVLALVFGPDGRTRVRREDTAEDAWSALWNGDDAHDPQATGRSGRRLRIGQEPHGPAVGPDDNGQWVLLGAHPLVDVCQRLIASR